MLPKDQRVPYEMIIGQAELESGWGTSRFEAEANNLFGIRTWNRIHIHTRGNKMARCVRAASKCDSVQEYVRLLNNIKHMKILECKTKDVR